MVVTDPARVTDNLRFFKMTGSGNDFVVVDVRKTSAAHLTAPATIQALCARGTGIGADGLVLLEMTPGADFRMAYYNADGSRASMCGNAALCCTRLVYELGLPASKDVAFETDAGPMQGRLRDGQPEIDMTEASGVRPTTEISLERTERRMGYAVVGVPHLTVLCDDVESIDLARRGKGLRSDPSVLPAGANANFVSKAALGGTWAMRTFERGVEGETLACGTGAVATAILLTEWGLASNPVALQTRSGRGLTVRLERRGERWKPSLAGEGRIVFEGLGRELTPT